MTLRTIGSTLLGGLIGGTVVWIGQSGSFRLIPADMSYSDLAAVLLAAVGVIVAIFGGVLALAAIWGFTQLKRDAVTAAEVAGASEIKQQINNGSIRDQILAEINRLTDAEFKSPRMDQRIQSRVDAVTFGRADADRLLENDGDEA